MLDGLDARSLLNTAVALKTGRDQKATKELLEIVLDRLPREGSGPECPACGERQKGKGEFRLCWNCNSDLVWVEGHVCEPGGEEELKSRLLAERRREEEKEQRRQQEEQRRQQEERRRQEERERKWAVGIIVACFIPFLLVLLVWGAEFYSGSKEPDGIDPLGPDPNTYGPSTDSSQPVDKAFVLANRSGRNPTQVHLDRMTRWRLGRDVEIKRLQDQFVPEVEPVAVATTTPEMDSSKTVDKSSPTAEAEPVAVPKTTPETDSSESRLFGRLDKDGDGMIQVAEMPTPLRERLKTFDTDGDGNVSSSEFRRGLEERPDVPSAIQNALK